LADELHNMIQQSGCVVGHRRGDARRGGLTSGLANPVRDVRGRVQTALSLAWTWGGRPLLKVVQ